MRAHVELNLGKIRSCRNIAGLERPLEPYAAPIRVDEGAPFLNRRGELILPTALRLPPTLYRYRTLIERAKHLAGLAQQLEATFLSALEKRDSQYCNLLKAKQDINLGLAGVRLRQLGLTEARDGVRLAGLQLERAQIQEQHYQSLLEESDDFFEKAGLVIMAAVGIAMIASGAGAFGAAASWKTISGGASMLLSTLTGVSDSGKRERELRQALKLSQQDVQIVTQQVRLANDRRRIAGQQLNIANMQADQARETLDFLANKFTNAELYDWMSGVLEEVYSTFLQQATSVAQLAANQLAFERQNLIPNFIQADYWESPLSMAAGFADGSSSPDRRGLTGSARLIQDVYQLDQYAFDTVQRKQQLTKTISLARMAPAEFQRFRETGVMSFNTLMEIFDRDFPGHYLRLIKNVRLSVIALIPPTAGIKATLFSSGISRVVVAGDSFQETVIRRQPESVSLTSATNATGQFEFQLRQDNEMLRPFEGNGVAAEWTFELPKPANQFDYKTIADVLITIDYTALYSPDYRQQMIQRLGRGFSADRGFSFRQEFADQWYDLHNPDQTAMPMVVRFRTTRDDFPPNTDDLTIQKVVLYFARTDEKSDEIEIEHLHFAEQDGATVFGEGATSEDGVISTRRGGTDSWIPMIGIAPFGDWELALPDSDEMRTRFERQEIEDILFVITYAARTPEWPI
ncbi:hypothetical protein ACFL6S_37550 [Candidatus Poribacteria bacterium]